MSTGMLFSLILIQPKTTCKTAMFMCQRTMTPRKCSCGRQSHKLLFPFVVPTARAAWSAADELRLSSV